MKRIALATVVGLALPAALALPAGVANASTTKCDPHSTTYAGACYTMSTFVKKTLIVQAAPVENYSSIPIKAHCSFTSTITESFTASASITASAKATVFGAVEVGVSATVSLSVSQTASQATSLGGSFTLKPGQSVTCERTYSLISTNVSEYDYNGLKSYTKNYSVTIPSAMGVRFA